MLRPANKLALSRIDWVLLGVIFCGLIAAHLAVGRLLWTGDEIQYTYQGLALFTNHSFYPSAPAWATFLNANGLSAPYQGQVATPFHSLFVSLTYGAVLSILGLEAARWLNFLVGCVAALVLFLLLKGQLNNAGRTARLSVYATVTAVVFSPAFLAYQGLLYPEMLLALVVSAALYTLSCGRYNATLFLVALLPFVYIRALPLAIAFCGVLLLDMLSRRIPATKVIGTFALFLLSLVVFAFYQYGLSGTLTGGVFPVYDPSLGRLPERLGMQLFGVRQGLIAYSPVFLVGFAGLVLGTLRRNRLSIYALILLLSYVATFIWSEAGEAWFGRFWIAALPLIAVGMCYWFDACRHWTCYLPAILLGIVGIVNSAIFLAYPLWFLESRRASVPYSFLARITHVNFGVYLPVDTNSNALLPYSGSIPYLLALASVLLGLLVTCDIARSGALRKMAGIACLAVLVAVLGVSATRPLLSNTYRVMHDRDWSRIVIYLAPGTDSVDALQFDDKLALVWSGNVYPRVFRIWCVRDDRLLMESLEPSRPLVALHGCRGADVIKLDGEPGHGVTESPNYGRVSLIHRLW